MGDTTPLPIDAAATEAFERARRLMNRESTDFIGRMGEALMSAEGLLDDGQVIEPGSEHAEKYREHMVELAALALAQAATVTGQ